ncbi:MAG: hypothetical protein VXX04_05025, partial [Actinomycetota bacterium]|nr:hypothetical protein [Actinomycetota bacterium]
MRDEHEGLGLEEHIELKRRELVNARLEVPALRDQMLALRARANGLDRRWQVRTRADLELRACALQNEIDVRLSMVREHAFESTVVTYLRRYYQRGGTDAIHSATRAATSIEAYAAHSDSTHQHRASIVDEYLTEVKRAPPKVAMAMRDTCPRCDARPPPQLLLCSARSIMSCPTCGYSVTYLDATSSTTSFDEIVEYSQYSYKRVNHYCMYLTLLQGREAHRVPDDVLTAVMTDLHDRCGVRVTRDITQRRVRESMRHLRLRRAYDHVVQVWARLTGQRPARIPPHVEEQLKNMFLQMQPAFQRHAPKSRTNFLSYSYVLYRCFQILGMHHML